MRTYSITGAYPEHTSGSELIVLGLISEGKMFRILKARQGTKIVILKTPVQNDSMSLELLRREYELSRTLIHPDIVRTFDFDETFPAIIMEYIEGKTLDEFIVSAPSLSQRDAVLNDILDATDYLHHRGILHNDLKPDNIIVNANGSARIIDFGLSGSDDSIYKGCIGGSDGYSAPEILSGKGPAGAASDIFSIGLLIRLMYGPRSYYFITKRCCKEDSAKRFKSVGALRNSIRKKKLAPWITSLCAAILVLAFMSSLPLLKEHSAETEVADLKDSFDRDYAQRFNETVIQYESAESIEAAKKVLNSFYKFSGDYTDSVQRVHPMSDTGEIAPEIFAVTALNRHYYAIIDSLLSDLKQKESLDRTVK